MRPVQDQSVHGAGGGSTRLLVVVLLLRRLLLLLLVSPGWGAYTTPLCTQPYVVGSKTWGRWGD